MTLSPVLHRAVFGLPADSIANRMDAYGEFFGNNGRATYPVDVREDADHFYVDAELPGFKRDQIEITLENTRLTITAEHRAAANGAHANAEDKGAQEPVQQPVEWLLSERRMRSFNRTFELPPTVDGANVSATLADGVLSIVLNKRQETKPRKITVG